LLGVGENNSDAKPLPLFDIVLDKTPPNYEKEPEKPISQPSSIPDSQPPISGHDVSDHGNNVNHHNIAATLEIQQAPELQRSSRIPKPSNTSLQSKEYQQQEMTSRGEEQDWAAVHTDASTIANWIPVEQTDYIACLAEMKAMHKIPHSYRHAMATDPDRWIIPMQIEMNTLKSKRTWDLVKSPPGANVMDSRWVYDIKWDGEGN
jgi:hypothetical protein